jgi:hypothetical protein
MGLQYVLTDDADEPKTDQTDAREEVRTCGRTRRSRESWRS